MRLALFIIKFFMRVRVSEVQNFALFSKLDFVFSVVQSRVMIPILRVWGMASILIIVALWLPSLQTWSPAEAVRSPAFDYVRNPSLSVPSSGSNPEYSIGQGTLLSQGRFGDLPAFREAPAFRNGRQCVSSRNRSQADGVCDASAVHIAMTLDAAYLRGSMAAIFSILKHSACPENVIFHFLVSDRDVELESLVQITFPFLKFKLYHFDEDLVKDRISSSIRSALEQPLNYARNYLADMLEPCVERVIYLDSDLVVVDDISKLWSTSLGPYAIGAPEYCHANFTKYFTSAFWGDFDLASTFNDRKPCYFNTGLWSWISPNGESRIVPGGLKCGWTYRRRTGFTSWDLFRPSCLYSPDQCNQSSTDGINMGLGATMWREGVDLCILAL